MTILSNVYRGSEQKRLNSNDDVTRTPQLLISERVESVTKMKESTIHALSSERQDPVQITVPGLAEKLSKV